MGITKAELTKDGNLKISGNINTRLPAITDGLIAFFPFDGTEKGINTGDLFNYQGEFPIGSQPLSKTGLMDTIYMEAEIYLNSYPSERYSFLYLTGPSTQGTSNMYLSVDSNGKVSVYEYAKVSNGYHASNQKLELNQWYTVGHLSTPDKTYILINGIIDREIDNLQEYLPDLEYVTRESGSRTLDGISRNVKVGSSSPIPSINTNNTITFDGIGIEEATENLCPEEMRLMSGVWNNAGGYHSSITVDYPKNYHGRQNVMRVVKTGTESHDCYMGKKDLYSTQIGDIFMLSYDVFVAYGNVDWTGPILYQDGWKLPADNQTATKEYICDIDLGRGWRRKIYKFTIDAAGSCLLRFSSGYKTEPYEMLIDNVQFEKKSFATSFVNGSRSSGQLIISDIGGLTNYTIFGKFVPDSGFKNNSNYEETISGSSLIGIEDTLNVGNFYYRFYLSGGVTSAPYLDPDGYYGTSHIHKSYEIEKLVPLYYVIRKEGTSVKFKIYQDGVWKDEHVMSTNSDARLDKIKIGTITRWNGLHKFLSIYNKSLSEDEIKDLINPNFPLQTNGDLIVSEIITKPNIPDDVYYFPLGCEAKDEYKVITPSSEVNTVYKDGSVWVGDSVTNIMSQTTYTSWTNSGSKENLTNYIKPLVSGVDSYGMKVLTDGSLGARWGYSTLPPNTSYSVSILVWVDSSDTNYFYAREYRDSATGGVNAGNLKYNGVVLNKANLPQKQWVLLTLENLTSASDAYAISICNYGGSAGTIILGCCFQCTLTDYVPPFANGTRGTSDLEFNFNQSIGLDWNGDWSIIYKKKPIGTHSGLTGYNLESLGCNSNSIGGGYRWWGKASGQNAVGYNSYDAIDINEYFGNWHFITIIKSGTTVTFRWYLSDGQIITKTSTVSGVASNYFVTQYGYDFKLGGWDNTQACNTYFKDLIVAKRCLTDNEIKAIYNSKMESMNDGTLRINSIQTGQVL